MSSVISRVTSVVLPDFFQPAMPITGMAPVRGFLGGRSTLFLSLDGQLNLLPFAAL